MRWQCSWHLGRGASQSRVFCKVGQPIQPQHAIYSCHCQDATCWDIWLLYVCGMGMGSCKPGSDHIAAVIDSGSACIIERI